MPNIYRKSGLLSGDFLDQSGNTQPNPSQALKDRTTTDGEGGWPIVEDSLSLDDTVRTTQPDTRGPTFPLLGLTGHFVCLFVWFSCVSERERESVVPFASKHYYYYLIAG